MAKFRWLPLGLALAFAAATAPATAAPAAGSFNYNGKDHAVTAGMAWRDEHFAYVVVSPRDFDRDAMRADGVFDESDLMAHPAASLRITIVPEDGSLFGIRGRDDAGSGADFRCEGPDLLALTTFDATRIAGTFRCEEHDLRFDLEIDSPTRVAH